MRANRKNKLALNMARKWAGVTKDDSRANEFLESRFKLFLANNTQGAKFKVQCVGLASITHMALAGDAKAGGDAAVNEFKDSVSPAVVEQVGEQFIQDRSMIRASLDLGHNFEPNEAAESAQHEVSDDEKERRSNYAPSTTTISSELSSTDGETSRSNKGTTLLKNVFTFFRPSAAGSTQPAKGSGESVHQSGSKSPSGASDVEGSGGSRHEQSVQHSNESEHGKSLSVKESGDSGDEQSVELCNESECGKSPFVEVLSRLGGHFDGELFMARGEVESHRNPSKEGDSSDNSHPQFLKLHADNPDIPASHGIVNLIDPVGISIISDIDDTIKVTDVVAGAKVVLQNTFLKDMREVDGMARVYGKWWKQGAAVHYVSNSPWQLIKTLLEFFENHHFPPGSAHLRLHDGLIKAYFKSPGEHKRKAIREILKDFPDRKFILVGDSGEIDMEIYTEIAIEYPDQIARIFIRDITTQRLIDLAAKAPPTRTYSFSALLPKVNPAKARQTSLQRNIIGNPPPISTEPISKEGDDATLTASPDDEGPATTATPLKPVRPRGGTLSAIRSASSSLLSLNRSKKTDESVPSDASKASQTTSQDTQGHENQSEQMRSGSPEGISSTQGDKDNSDNSTLNMRGPALAVRGKSAPTSPTSFSFSPEVHGQDKKSPSVPQPARSTSPSPAASATKTPLDIWRERQAKCHMQLLPSGIKLTLFKSADELENCDIVQSLFKAYNDPRTDKQDVKAEQLQKESLQDKKQEPLQAKKQESSSQDKDQESLQGRKQEHEQEQVAKTHVSSGRVEEQFAAGIPPFMPSETPSAPVMC